MAVVKRPKLADKMIAAQMRDRAIQDAQKATRESGAKLSEYEKKIARQAKWEQRGAEKVYFNQSGQGIPPWEQSLQR